MPPMVARLLVESPARRRGRGFKNSLSFILDQPRLHPHPPSALQIELRMPCMWRDRSTMRPSVSDWPLVPVRAAALEADLANSGAPGPRVVSNTTSA